MSVLNKNELKQLALNGLLGNDYIEDNFQPSSYDLRIGTIFKDGEIFSNDFKTQLFTNNIDIKPSEIVQILTLEKVTIPNNYIGTVFAMNSHSSTGLLILNPGHIDPGYSGYLSICLINLSKDVRTLSLGDSIFTLIIQELKSELSKGQEYKNNNNSISRKEFEQIFLKTKSKRLSKSFFDLIKGYNGLKKMLLEHIVGMIWKNIKSLGIIFSLIAAFIALVNFFPKILPFNNYEYRIQKLDTTIKLKTDTILKLKDSLRKK